jgi:trehalose 6-phosphate phosphatase
MVIAAGLPALPANGAVFLDFDGTLVEIAPTPELVDVPPALKRLLAGLADRFTGAVAVVSGRSIADLEAQLAPVRLPSAGLHGLERRRPDGSIERSAAPRWVADLVPEIEAFARLHPGVRVENKKLSIAVHYRTAPEAETAVRQFVDACAAALEHQAVVQLGKMVVEIRPAGRDKGAAIAAFMPEAPFRDRIPAFLGDDLTDEHGFEAVNRLGGLSIRVGPPAETTARWALPSVEAARAWLEHALDKTGT